MKTKGSIFNLEARRHDSSYSQRMSNDKVLLDILISCSCLAWHWACHLWLTWLRLILGPYRKKVSVQHFSVYFWSVLFVFSILILYSVSLVSSLYPSLLVEPNLFPLSRISLLSQFGPKTCIYCDSRSLSNTRSVMTRVPVCYDKIMIEKKSPKEVNNKEMSYKLSLFWR